MIGIIDYGLGNVQAFLNVFSRLNIPAMAVRTKKELPHADRFILPGVGSFDWAMKKLHQSGMRDALDDLVCTNKQPVLGVCVGMQIMARRSEEGKECGLGWIPGEVVRFAEHTATGPPHLPHMGWNDVAPQVCDSLFRGITDPRFYFLHSYHFVPDDPEHILGTTNYGLTFASAVSRCNIFGAQFHPEKSHSWGIQLLKVFSEL